MGEYGGGIEEKGRGEVGGLVGWSGTRDQRIAGPE